MASVTDLARYGADGYVPSGAEVMKILEQQMWWGLDAAKRLRQREHPCRDGHLGRTINAVDECLDEYIGLMAWTNSRVDHTSSNREPVL